MLIMYFLYNCVGKLADCASGGRKLSSPMDIRNTEGADALPNG